MPFSPTHDLIDKRVKELNMLVSNRINNARSAKLELELAAMKEVSRRIEEDAEKLRNFERKKNEELLAKRQARQPIWKQETGSTIEARREEKFQAKKKGTHQP